ncbi:MAG: ArsR family transcriptional regulator [Haloarculaceae archaeon]
MGEQSAVRAVGKIGLVVLGLAVAMWLPATGMTGTARAELLGGDTTNATDGSGGLATLSNTTAGTVETVATNTTDTVQTVADSTTTTTDAVTSTVDATTTVTDQTVSGATDATGNDSRAVQTTATTTTTVTDAVATTTANATGTVDTVAGTTTGTVTNATDQTVAGVANVTNDTGGVVQSVANDAGVGQATTTVVNASGVPTVERTAASTVTGVNGGVTSTVTGVEGPIDTTLAGVDGSVQNATSGATGVASVDGTATDDAAPATAVATPNDGGTRAAVDAQSATPRSERNGSLSATGAVDRGGERAQAMTTSGAGHAGPGGDDGGAGTLGGTLGAVGVTAALGIAVGTDPATLSAAANLGQGSAIGGVRTGSALGSDGRDGLVDRLWRLVTVFRYSRYDSSDPLEHDDRARAHEVIEEAPGIHLSAVADRIDVPLSTVRHHLRILEQEDLIDSAKIRGKRQYFPPETDHQELVSVLNEPATAEILEVLARLGEAHGGRIADALHKDPSTIAHHLSRLEEQGLIEREQSGPAMINSLAPVAARAVDAQFDPAPADD